MYTREQFKNTDKTPAVSYTYDSYLKQLDGSFWGTITGTPAYSSGQHAIDLDAASMASFIQPVYGKFLSKISIPAVPTSGDSRIFGFFNPNGTEKITFDITGTAVTAKYNDGKGNSGSIAISAALITAATHEFEIRWNPGSIGWFIDGDGIAAVELATMDMPMSLYFLNGNSDHVYVYNVSILEAGRIN